MSIGLDLRTDLPKGHRQALFAAVDSLIDEFVEDLCALQEGQEFAQVSMFEYLPCKYLHRYNFLFAKKFLTCVVAVAWKLSAPDHQPLACVAEELALNAIIDRAKVVLELEGVEADFNLFYDCAFKDADFEILFDAGRDGYEDADELQDLGMINLHFEDWFEPFYDIHPVHPYVENGRDGD